MLAGGTWLTNSERWSSCRLTLPPATIYCAPVFVLRYKREGEFRVVILDAISVAHARMTAAWLEPGTFIDGRSIDEATAARLSPRLVGRVLTRRELTTLAAGKKKPPAPKVRRRRGPALRHVNSNVSRPIPAPGDE